MKLYFKKDPIKQEMLEMLLSHILGVGKWLSAALSDPKTCKEFKKDINEWFKIFDLIEKATGKSINEVLNEVV